jgi:hypothetical protein
VSLRLGVSLPFVAATTLCFPNSLFLTFAAIEIIIIVSYDSFLFFVPKPTSSSSSKIIIRT